MFRTSSQGAWEGGWCSGPPPRGHGRAAGVQDRLPHLRQGPAGISTDAGGTSGGPHGGREEETSPPPVACPPHFLEGAVMLHFLPCQRMSTPF